MRKQVVRRLQIIGPMMLIGSYRSFPCVAPICLCPCSTFLDVWRIRPKNSPAARSALKRESGGNQGLILSP